MDKSGDSVFEEDDIEVDEKADLLAAESKIGEKLGLVQRRDLFDALEFQDGFVINHNIQTIPTIQSHVLIVDRQRDLSHERQVSKGQLTTQALFIRRFQKPRSQLPMDLHGRPNDLPRQLLVNQHPALLYFLIPSVFLPYSFRAFSVFSVPPW
jgi:hypothetical protein